MRISRAGREFVHWPFTADGDVLSADVLLNGTWHAASVEETTVSVMVAGPSAASNPGGTVVLPMGSHEVLIRFNDDPELVVRPAGELVIY